VETVVVRATQFHSLLAMMFGAGTKVRIIPVVRGARFQPVAPAEVAATLLEAAFGPALVPAERRRHRVMNFGGPEVRNMTDFAREWQHATGARGRLMHLPLPGAMGRYLRLGLNLVPEARHGAETFRGWLENNADSL
jgi:uncharacterized protein YbjT (DUF2867 family)